MPSNSLSVATSSRMLALPSAPRLNDLPVGLRRGEREQIALNHVVNVGEIARLQAVAGDRRALIVQH